MIVGYDPKTYHEASLHPIWKKTMEEEFRSLQDNETWELVPLLSKRKLVQCKWVYRNKIIDDGSDNKYNSRIVSKGLSKCFKYTLGSYLHLSNPSDRRKLSILAYQALWACLKP